MSLLETALTPIHFFDLEVRCPKKLSPLPDLSALNTSASFAEVWFGWDAAGIQLLVKSRSPLSKSYWPEFERGDALELLLDTRANKAAGSTTRFCHHFVFLPVPAGSFQAAEVTRLRGTEKRPLCAAEELVVNTQAGERSYTMNVSVPASCLHGYDPCECPWLGFNTIVHRRGRPQPFAISSEDFTSPDQQPALWATLQLVS